MSTQKRSSQIFSLSKPQSLLDQCMDSQAGGLEEGVQVAYIFKMGFCMLA